MLHFDSISTLKHFFFKEEKMWLDDEPNLIVVEQDGLRDVVFTASFDGSCLNLDFESKYDECVFSALKGWGLLNPNKMADDKLKPFRRKDELVRPSDNYITHYNGESSIQLSLGWESVYRECVEERRYLFFLDRTDWDEDYVPDEEEQLPPDPDDDWDENDDDECF